MLEVSAVNKKVNQYKVLNNVSFKVNPGEIYGILGGNGAGKTTLLRIISSQMKPDSGSVSLYGENVTKDHDVIRGRLGMLSKDWGLYGRLTARENIRCFALLHNIKMKEFRVRMDRLIEELDMAEFIDRPCDKLTQVQRHKTLLARAIIHDPDVLLFDQPAEGLDMHAAKKFYEFLRQHKEKNKIILITESDAYTLEALCDRVTILANSVQESGTVEEICRKMETETLTEAYAALSGGEY